jgi:hypothetical protein
MLAVLAVLGVIVTVALIMVRLRVDLIPSEEPAAAAGRRRFWALVVALLTLIVFLVVVHEWVFGLAAPVPEDLSATDVRAVVRNTWLPPAFTTAVQVLAGVLAGVAIGVLRPIGASSEALLLLFAPGLFVGLTPLLTPKHLSAAAVPFAEINLVTPMLLSVPAVFVFTYVFAGLRRAWVRDPAARVPVLLTGMSTVLLVAVLSWVVQAQSVTWNLVVAANSSRVAGPLLLGRLRSEDPLAPLPQQLATPVPLLIMLAALAALATVGLDRLVLRSGPVRNRLSRD